MGSHVPGFSVPAPGTGPPTRTPVLRPGSVPESPARCGRVQPPSLHPAAWFKAGSAMQLRDE